AEVGPVRRRKAGVEAVEQRGQAAEGVVRQPVKGDADRGQGPAAGWGALGGGGGLGLGFRSGPLTQALPELVLALIEGAGGGSRLAGGGTGRRRPRRGRGPASRR